jgi:hypothetical protein
MPQFHIRKGTVFKFTRSQRLGFQVATSSGLQGLFYLNKIDAFGPLALWTPLEEGMRILAINHEPCPKSVYELKQILQNSIGFITIHAVEQAQPEWFVENEAESEEEENSDHDHYDDEHSNSTIASNQPKWLDYELYDDEHSNSTIASNQPKGRRRRRRNEAELDALNEKTIMQELKRIFLEYMNTEQQEKGNDPKRSEVFDAHDENTLARSSHIKHDSKADPKSRKANALQQPKAEAIAVAPRQKNTSEEQNMSPKYSNAEAETLHEHPIMQELKRILLEYMTTEQQERGNEPKYCNTEAEKLHEHRKPCPPGPERQRIKPILAEAIAVPPRQQNTSEEQNMSPKYSNAEAETLHEHRKPCPPRPERQRITPILETRKHQRQHASPSRKEVLEKAKANNGTIRGSSSGARRAQKNQIVDDLEEESSRGWDDESRDDLEEVSSRGWDDESSDDLEEESSRGWDDESRESCRKGNHCHYPHASPSPTRRDRLLSHKTQMWYKDIPSSKNKHHRMGGKLSSKSIVTTRKRSRDREIRSEKREVNFPKSKAWPDTSRLRKKDETVLTSEDRIRMYHQRERTDDTDDDSRWWGFPLFNCGCSSGATDPDLFA